MRMHESKKKRKRNYSWKHKKSELKSKLKIFSLTALSCQKLEIHVGNWAEAISVISTLWLKDFDHIAFCGPKTCCLLSWEVMTPYWRYSALKLQYWVFSYFFPHFFVQSYSILWNKLCLLIFGGTYYIGTYYLGK